MVFFAHENHNVAYNTMYENEKKMSSLYVRKKINVKSASYYIRSLPKKILKFWIKRIVHRDLFIVVFHLDNYYCDASAE